MYSRAASPVSLFPTQERGGGREDERYLWPEMLRATDEIRPSWVIGENVTGITTMVEGGVLTNLGLHTSLFAEADDIHGYELWETFTIERICQDFERIGYSVQPMLIPAAAVGAPHRRDRIFILAHIADSPCMHGNGCRHGDPSHSRQSEPQFRDCGGKEIIADTDSGRSGKVSAEIFSGEPDGDKPFCNESPSHAYRERLAIAIQRGFYGAEEWDGEKRSAVFSPDDAGIEGKRWHNFPTVSPVHRGNDGIPIRLDNLSLPESMRPRSYRNSDEAKFNFGKWRTESLKAYGNAIVPQVMYEIFLAIDKIEKQ